MSTNSFNRGLAGAFAGAQSAISMGAQLQQIKDSARNSAISQRMAVQRHELAMKQGEQGLRLASAREKRAVQEHGLRVRQLEQAMEAAGLQIDAQQWEAEVMRPLREQQLKQQTEFEKTSFEAQQRKETAAMNAAGIATLVTQAQTAMQQGDYEAANRFMTGAEEFGYTHAGSFEKIQEDMQYFQGLMEKGEFDPKDPKANEILSRHLMTSMGLTGRLGRGLSFHELVPIEGDPTGFHMIMTDQNGRQVPLTEGATDDPSDPPRVIRVDRMALAMNQNAQNAGLRASIDRALASTGVNPAAQRQSALAAAQAAQLDATKTQSEINKNNAAAEKARAEAAAKRQAKAEASPIAQSFKADSATKWAAPLVQGWKREFPALSDEAIFEVVNSLGESTGFGPQTEAAQKKAAYDALRARNESTISQARSAKAQTHVDQLLGKIQQEYGDVAKDEKYVRMEIADAIERLGGEAVFEAGKLSEAQIMELVAPQLEKEERLKQRNQEALDQNTLNAGVY